VSNETISPSTCRRSVAKSGGGSVGGSGAKAALALAGVDGAGDCAGAKAAGGEAAWGASTLAHPASKPTGKSALRAFIDVSCRRRLKVVP
jgi:hypothetical protein